LNALGARPRWIVGCIFAHSHASFAANSVF